MGLLRGALLASAAAALSLAALPSTAAPLTALSPKDVTLYATAFDAAERGDAAAADQALAQVSDPCLTGKVQYLEFTHAKPRATSFETLSNWLKSFSDLPGASFVYQMALKLKPAGELPPAPATAVSAASDGPVHMAPAPQSRAAREAYFNGEVSRALQLARSSGDAWIAGLAAYRLEQYADSMISFETLAANQANDDATRAAGGVWAARAAVAAGLPDRATSLLKIAAASPDTFYGMIAKRKLELADDPLGRLIDTASVAPPAAPSQPAFIRTSYSPGQGENALDRLVRTDPRARRAVALMQVSRPIDAGAELRAGYAEATDEQTRALWMGLMFELNPRPQTGEIALHSAVPMAAPQTVYPTPNLTPSNGFTVDKALVYAVAWQESRFNPIAVSPVGAVGLMQLMPPSAASMAGDPTLKTDPITLFDSGKNLALGQAYLTWLENNAGAHDLLRTVAAYNGGPATLTRTEALLGPDADSLLIIETVPFAETRAYVKKAVAAYWAYRRQFGAPTRTLDAVASDQAVIDVRLDQSAPVENPQPTATTARDALEILLHRAG
jgi:soluble lytic murein transglycosylase-like protein